MSRNILVIGGTNYFGKHLVEMLLTAGDRLWIAARGNNPIPPQASFIYFDRLNNVPLKTNTVYDLVYDQSCYTSSTLNNLLKVIRNCGTYILTSSQAVYQNNLALKEDRIDYNKIDEYKDKINNYGMEKLKAEAYVAKQAINYIFPRFPIILGKNDPRTRLQNLIKHIKSSRVNLPLSNPLLQYLDEYNAATSLYKLPLSKHNGAINIACPEIITAQELCQTIAKLIGKELKINWCTNYTFTPFDLVKDATKTLDTAKQTILDLKFKNINNILKEIEPSLNLQSNYLGSQ